MRTLPLLLLCGCAAVAGPDYYRNTPTAELCRLYLTLPSYNLNHPARSAELARRGESCGSPAEVARAQRESAEQYNRAIQSTLPAAPPPPTTCTTTYVGQQAYTTCR